MRMLPGVLKAVGECGRPDDVLFESRDFSGRTVVVTFEMHRNLEIKNKDYWDRWHRRSDASKRGWAKRRGQVSA